jgi:prolyl 4-hydroxylase
MDLMHSTITDDFIGIYPYSLTKKQCDFLIRIFHKYESEFGHEGVTAQGTNKGVKDTRDLAINRNHNKYLKWINIILRKKLWDSVNHYTRKYSNLGEILKCDSGFQIQHYKKNKIGYIEHSDNGGGFSMSSNRTLVFMWYLNDVDSGGETNFLHFNKYVKPKAGTLVLFPPYWTHQHQAMPPLSNDKYIITNWLFNIDYDKFYEIELIYNKYKQGSK